MASLAMARRAMLSKWTAVGEEELEEEDDDEEEEEAEDVDSGEECTSRFTCGDIGGISAAELTTTLLNRLRQRFTEATKCLLSLVRASAQGSRKSTSR